MRKKVKIGILIFIILIGSAIIGNSEQKTKMTINTLGSNPEVKLKVELPQKPEKIPYYKVVDLDKKIYASKELMRPVNNLPSTFEAKEIAKRYIEQNGGLPDGLILKNIGTVKLKGIDTTTGEIVAEKLVSINIIYGREVNGFSVIGPKADAIAVSVSKNVNYFSKLWRKIEYAGEVKLIPSKIAFEKLKKGEIMNIPMENARSLEIFDIKPGYYVGSEDQKVYIPVWIFYCMDERGNKLSIAVNATGEFL